MIITLEQTEQIGVEDDHSCVAAGGVSRGGGRARSSSLPHAKGRRETCRKSSPTKARRPSRDAR